MTRDALVALLAMAQPDHGHIRRHRTQSLVNPSSACP
jgi:hypothetical protein